MYICARVYLWVHVYLWVRVYLCVYVHIWGQSQPGAETCCFVVSLSWEWLNTCVSSLPVQPVIFSPSGPGRIRRIPWFGGDPGHPSRKWASSERVKDTKAAGHSELLNVQFMPTATPPSKAGAWGR